MEYIVYKITDTVNSKLYFGITQQSLIKRWQQNKQPKNVSWHFFQDRQMEDWEIEKLAMREILTRMTQNPSYMMFFN